MSCTIDRKKWLGNIEALNERLRIADECLDDMINWLKKENGQVGIYDGNNVTEARRRQIYNKLLQKDIHVRDEAKKKLMRRDCNTHFMVHTATLYW